uniref:sulfate anion transporter 1-like isoform X1 n=1 Tax=Styela clava TaxID=7725 RepID=UPI00193ADAC3|nr:sulfate anion transporter 1-like isoform X1 [Styela clava]
MPSEEPNNNDVNINLECSGQIFTEEQLAKRYGYPWDNISTGTKLKIFLKDKLKCSRERAKRFITSLVPILIWLPQYKIKSYLPGDLIAGFTVAMVLLPQGMAYSMLASLPPVQGLYTSFFPVILYALLGTSNQVSMGTFAVGCIMVGDVIDKHVNVDDYCKQTITTSQPINSMVSSSETWETTSTTSCNDLYMERRIELAIAICLAVGVIQVVMYILRLGKVTMYLSEHLVSGFTCGAVFPVLSSQIPKLLGIPVQKYSDPLSIIYTFIDMFSNITSINWATVIVSTVCSVVLIVGKIINVRYYDRLPIPIPWEVFIVIFSTIASYYGLLYENHSVSVVGDIPTGFQLSVPDSHDIGSVMLESIPVAIVIYAIEISLAKMFAIKSGCEIDANQELMAMGSANIVGCFFSCFPCAVALSRTAISDEVGGKTQITGLIAASIILTVILWIGPLFESLPEAALAVIILVNIKGMLRQFERIRGYWEICKLDAITWLVTWACVVFIGVDIGLLIGVGFELITVVCNTQTANGYVLGEIEGTGSYKNVKRYKTKRKSDRNIIIFSYSGPLYFANLERFRSQFCKSLGFDPTRSSATYKERQGNSKKSSLSGVQNEGFTLENANSNEEKDSGINTISSINSLETNTNINSSVQADSTVMSSSFSDVDIGSGVTHVILDMSACSYIDNGGAKLIKSVFTSLKALDILLMLCHCNESVRKSLGFVFKTGKPPFFFSLDGAVSHARGEILLNIDDHGNVIEDTNVKRIGTLF